MATGSNQARLLQAGQRLDEAAPRLGVLHALTNGRQHAVCHAAAVCKDRRPAQADAHLQVGVVKRSGDCCQGTSHIVPCRESHCSLLLPALPCNVESKAEHLAVLQGCRVLYSRSMLHTGICQYAYVSPTAKSARDRHGVAAAPPAQSGPQCVPPAPPFSSAGDQKCRLVGSKNVCMTGSRTRDSKGPCSRVLW
jgi:hypothetical protein